MRILADIPSNDILQVEKVPEVGATVPINGKYSIPMPEGVTVYVHPDSFILPASNPGSVVAQSYAGLLAAFPQYENILFNPLLVDTDIDDLDLTASLNEGHPPTVSHPTRAQTGRGTAGPLPSGTVPTSTALLEANDSLIPNRPGILVTDTIDIGPLTGFLGSDEFCVYWYLYDFDTTQDVHANDLGAVAGENTPALRNILEVDQEPTDLQVFLSINDGATYTEVQRLVPIAFCNPGLLCRIAFKNNNASAKKYIAGYALLF